MLRGFDKRDSRAPTRDTKYSDVFRLHAAIRTRHNCSKLETNMSQQVPNSCTIPSLTCVVVGLADEVAAVHLLSRASRLLSCKPLLYRRTSIVENALSGTRNDSSHLPLDAVYQYSYESSMLWRIFASRLQDID